LAAASFEGRSCSGSASTVALWLQRGIGAVYERGALGSAALRTHRKRANGPPNVGPVEVALLGPLEIRLEKGPVQLTAPKQRAVVELLVLAAGRHVTAEFLIAGLWGESPPASAAKVLQTYVSRLRRAVPELCLMTSRNGYSLKLEPGSVDTQRFEGAVREASRRIDTGDARGAVAVLAQALDLWRGRPCEELVEHSWATAEVARLEEMHREAEDDLADLRLAIGEHNAMVGQLEAAVAAEPLRERRWAQLMLAYYRSGRQADALRAFGRLRLALAEELGLSPSADLAALEQKVLLQSPELDQRPLAAEAPRGPPPVPHPASSFVGRVEEVAEVAKLVGERRLVTLAGAGGCGKTRLAQEVAATVAGRFSEGAHFVALAPVADPAGVPLAVAEALGVRPQSGRPITQVVAEVVGQRETLAVVDNCEHLVGAVAEVVEELLQGAPGLRVVATSREPLRISAETVWRVPSLEVPAAGASAAECRGCGAVELFVDRAQAAGPDVVLDDRAVATIAEITRRLDGLPLAIELAAARVAVLDLGSILGRLADRFAFLTGGSRTAPARQQTLRAAVAWSYDLLKAREQRLFCCLSVFSGSFSLDAALALAGPAPEEAAEDIFSLVSKSMVATVGDGTGPTRYYLHESLREFGAVQLGESGTAQALVAHADYYLSLVRSVGPEPFGGAMTPWLKSIELELHNVRAVFSYLLSRPERRDDLLGALVTMRRYWDIYDRGREGFDLLERSLASAGPSDDPVLRAKALVAAADVASHLDASVSARYAKAGGELALDLGDRGTAALAAALIASVNGLAGRYNEAEGERALRLARQVGEPWLVCEGLIALGLSVDVRSRPGVERARAPLEELLATAEASGDIYFIYAAHDNLCPYGFFYDDPGAVRPHVERLGVLADEFGVSRVWEDLRRGELLYAEGNYAGALDTHCSIFESARRRDFPCGMADAAKGAASCLLALGEDEEAVARLYGFAAQQVGSAGFGERYEGNRWVEADMDVLRARLGDSLAGLLAEGAAMRRDEVTEMLAAGQ
jgi:predicted ATPase/DNA-binding SARP family transcriptional activator